jgi:hypothetical protein
MMWSAGSGHHRSCCKKALNALLEGDGFHTATGGHAYMVSSFHLNVSVCSSGENCRSKIAMKVHTWLVHVVTSSPF